MNEIQYSCNGCRNDNVFFSITIPKLHVTRTNYGVELKAIMV